MLKILKYSLITTTILSTTCNLQATLNPFEIPKFLFDSQSILISPNHTLSYPLNIPKLKELLNKQITLYSYEKNTISENITQDFNKDILKTKYYNEKNIEIKLNKYLSAYFKKNIQDLEKLQKTKEILTKNKKKSSFAETKGKSNSLTQSDLAFLQNSSFIYIPYIENIDEISVKEMEKPIKTSLIGGIIWYRLISNPDNSLRVEFLKKIPIDVHDASRWIEIDVYEEFAAAAQNKSQTMPELKEKIHLKSAINDEYILDPTALQHLKLGDEFLLKGYEVNTSGQQIVKQGLIKITQIGNSNKKDTKAKQIWGKWQGRGSWAESYPRLGINWDINYSQLLDIENKNLKAIGSHIYFPLDQLSNKANTYLSIGANLSLSQLQITNHADYDITLKRLNQWTLNFHKQYWIDGHGFGGMIGIGAQQRAYGQRLRTKNWEFSWVEEDLAFIARLGLDYQKALNENWFFNASLSRNFVSPALFNLLGSEEKSEINFSSYQVSAGFIYAIPKNSTLASGSWKRSVSSILDIWRGVYYVVKFFMDITNTGIEHRDEEEDDDKEKDTRLERKKN
eukprot:COSAG01_NODE_1461_length_10242_cov_4.896283_7_plen_566_part_00